MDSLPEKQPEKQWNWVPRDEMIEWGSHYIRLEKIKIESYKGNVCFKEDAAEKGGESQSPVIKVEWGVRQRTEESLEGKHNMK